ncbi:radical SAM protein [Magnetospirillum sp. 15-1]|uniref:radical SAM/SPASM domain-containing protein n=1 Tax=Magnetospirillum sp. 15-1 TaxID=1979370 RepID=UPI00148360D7|nr:radical SAM protein [Magnetospirillum sp. 15-1]
MDYGFDSERAKDFPPMVVVSITNVCNQRCIHCHWEAYSHHAGYVGTEMPWDVWVKIIDEMALHPWSILNLGTDGEPLTHRRFIDMMRYAKGKGIQLINLTTNGTLLTPEKAEIILHERLIDIINISLDAFHEETYERIRKSRHYKKVHDNIHRLIDRRAALQAPARIQVNIIDQEEARAEIPAFVEYWQPLVDNVMVRTYYDATHVTGQPGPNLTGKQVPFEPVERWPCQQFWRRFNINEVGEARYCVDDWYNKSKIGDIRTSSIKEIWQSSAYEEYRQIHLRGDFHANPFCADCTEWQGMRWDYDYFTAIEKMTGKKPL